MDNQAAWRKSRASSGAGQCVEVRLATHTGDTVLVRDSKNPNGPVLTFTFDEWRAFLAGVGEEEFTIERLTMDWQSQKPAYAGVSEGPGSS